MNSVEKRSVPERKSKILQFYNGWPGLAGQAGSPRVAWAWRHHARSLAHWCPVGTGHEETRGRSVSGRAQMPREISSNSLFLRNDLLNFKVDANKLFLWVTLSFTIFESRLTWNTTDSIDPWDGLCTCRQITVVGVKSFPTELSDPSPSIQGLCVTQVLPPAGLHDHPRPTVDGWVCSPAILTARGGCSPTPVAQNEK